MPALQSRRKVCLTDMNDLLAETFHPSESLHRSYSLALQVTSIAGQHSLPSRSARD